MGQLLLAVKSFIIFVMHQAEASIAKRPGRPLSFDREKALGDAMIQFWRTGYETTSVSTLTNAMGITAPSLYTAFGDKESLFLECLEKYSNPGPKSTPVLIAEASSARQAAQALLESAARWFTQPGYPAGCMVASAASSGSEISHRVRAALTTIRKANMKALQKRAERDIREGQLPKTTDVQALSSMTIAVMQGMSTLARDGANTQALFAVARTALLAWPIIDPD